MAGHLLLQNQQLSLLAWASWFLVLCVLSWLEGPLGGRWWSKPSVVPYVLVVLLSWRSAALVVVVPSVVPLVAVARCWWLWEGVAKVLLEFGPVLVARRCSRGVGCGGCRFWP